ncbi:hypothetical protein DFAR_3790006 [Desulfarculales bacterium]
MVEHHRPRKTGIISCHLGAIVFFVAACVKKIIELGRRFPWPRPERYPRCGSVWPWEQSFRTSLF